MSHDHFNQFSLTKRKITRTFAPYGNIDTTKYFGSCATHWTVSDLDWVSTSTILNFRIRIGFGAYEIFLDPIRLQNCHICTPLICWQPSNHACWSRLAGSGRGADQGHGNCRI